MKKAFMIMQIGNPDLDDMYVNIYRSIAQECGLKLFRVDKDNEGDLIKKTIDKYLEDAEIIIADITNERPSCYHEIGYAYGLKKQLNVILTVREDHLPTSISFNNKGTKIHFDLQNYPIITWKVDQIDEFKKTLLNEIKRRLSELEKRKEKRTLNPKNDEWFSTHLNVALSKFGKFKEKGFIEIDISSDSFITTFRQDKIRDIVMSLGSFRHRFPFAFLVELNKNPFKWNILKNEIIKDFVIKE